MTKRLLLAAALTLLSAAASAATSVVTAAHLFDPATGRTLDQPVVVVTDGRVAALATAGGTRPAIPEGARRIDLGDVTCPG